MALPLVIGAAAMRVLPAATRSVIKYIQKYGRSAAIRNKDIGRAQVEAAEKAVAKAQPVRTAASKATGAVKTQANKLVGRGNQVKRTPTKQGQQNKKTGKFMKPEKVERYDRMGGRVAARRAKKAAVGTVAGAAAIEGGSALMNQKKTSSGPSGQMKRNAPKSTASAPKAKNYNVGKSKGGVSFDEAFAHFRKKGSKTFTWNGKKYTTELKKGK